MLLDEYKENKKLNEIGIREQENQVEVLQKALTSSTHKVHKLQSELDKSATIDPVEIEYDNKENAEPQSRINWSLWFVLVLMIAIIGNLYVNDSEYLPAQLRQFNAMDFVENLMSDKDEVINDSKIKDDESIIEDEESKDSLIIRLQSTLENKKAKIRVLQQEMEIMELKEIEKKSEIDKLQIQVEESNIKDEDKKNSLIIRLENTLENKTTKIRVLKQEMELREIQKKSEIEKLQIQAEDMNKMYFKVENNHNKILVAHDDLVSRIDQKRSHIKTLENKIEKLKKEIYELKTFIKELMSYFSK
eukprot:139706_1